MNTNFNPLNSGLFPMLDAQVMSTSLPSAGVSSSTQEASMFGNLLDLVSDIQLAEEQGPGHGDFLQDESSRLFDPQMQSLVVAASQVGMTDPLLSKTDPKLVGQPNVRDISTPSVETSSVNDLLLGAQELDNMARSGMLEKSQFQSEHNVESARLWGAAIALGDLKSVTIDPEAPVRTEQSSVIFTEKMLATPTSSLPQGLVEPRVATQSSPLATAVRSSQETTSPGEALTKVTASKSESASTENRSVQVMPSSNDASKTRAATTSDSQGEQGFQAFNPKEAPVVRMSENEKKKPMTGGEFVLDRTAAQAPTHRTSTTLVASSALGQHNDRRISQESIDFVADKVDALKRQGGGQLRVELNPVELGAVEIRVSERGGQMKVEILAERADTMKALANVKSELASKLQTIAPSSLDVGQLGTRATARIGSGELSSSSELLKVRSMDASRTASVASSGIHISEGLRSVSSGSSESLDLGDRSSGRQTDTSQRESFGEGHQREERREKALNTWEDTRKSA